MTLCRFDRMIYLTSADAKAFCDSLDNPPKPNDKLKEAFESYYKSNIEPPSSLQSEEGAMDGCLKEKKSKKARLKRIKEKPPKIIESLDFGSKVLPNLDFPGMIVLTLPLRTVSEANCFEPWQKKHKRHKAQKKAIFFAILEHKHLIQLPCRITFIRYAPKPLDKHDNLPISQKYICDQLCAEITNDHRPGRADDNSQIEIKYDQVKSKVYGVKIIIEF